MPPLPLIPAWLVSLDLTAQWEGKMAVKGAHMLTLRGIVGDHARAHYHDSCPVNRGKDGQGRPAFSEQRQRFGSTRAAQTIPAANTTLLMST